MKKASNWRINEQVRAEKLRVLADDGTQIGVLSREAALKEAKERQLDLVEIAPKASPPVVKIIDLGKFIYQEEKKLKKQKKGSKGSEVKEIRFSPFIAENDYRVRVERIRKFLEDKDKVRVVVVFKGRQMESKAFGYDLFKKILADLDKDVNIDMKPKFFGRYLSMVISPLSKAKTEKRLNENEKNKAKN